MSRPDHTLEFLLAFDGRRHFYEDGYYVKFEIERVKARDDRPHGLRYSFTLHGPDGTRLVGFDNAHAVPTGRYKRKPKEADHWHRTAEDPGRPYRFQNAETLLEDFFGEVECVLTEMGVPFDVVDVDEGSEN
ncbi:MAG: DUF6516 family protein [Alphaproteobacteria bacterium]